MAARKKKILNFNIEPGLADEFKEYCENSDITMSMIMTTFIKQFLNNEFRLIFDDHNRLKFVMVDKDKAKDTSTLS